MDSMDRIRELVTVVPNENNNIAKSLDEISIKIKRLHTRKVLVPVICEDMYEFVNPYDKKRQSLHSYMVEKIIEEIAEKGDQLILTEQELDDIMNKGYYGISLLYARNKNEEIKIDEELYNSVFNEDDSIVHGVGIKEEVRNFLKAGNFPLIITTNSFPILEKELGSQYNSYWSEAETKNDSAIPDYCIYHIFGEAKPGNSAWGYSDKQILRFLRSALSSEYALKNLNEVINDNKNQKVLFFIGNDSPDWLFRFILSPLYGKNVYDEGAGGIYMSDEDHEDESSLIQFLHDIKFDRESQLMSVLENVTLKMKPANKVEEKKHSKEYDFFVAHASEDKEKAKQLVKILRKHDLKVWVDYENIYDGLYWERIINGLKNAAYFMPLITENYISKTVDYKKQKLVLEEFGNSQLMDKHVARELNEKLGSGVQAELLLADISFEMIKASDIYQSAYSVPVLCENEEFYDEPLTTRRVENWAQQYRLPRSLFWGVEMYGFDISNPEVFERGFHFNRYKNII